MQLGGRVVLPSDASVLSHVFRKYFRKFLNQQAFKFLKRKNTHGQHAFAGDPPPELKQKPAEPQAQETPCPRGAVCSAPEATPGPRQRVTARDRGGYGSCLENKLHSNAISLLLPLTTKSQLHGQRGFLHMTHSTGIVMEYLTEQLLTQTASRPLCAHSLSEAFGEPGNQSSPNAGAP